MLVFRLVYVWWVFFSPYRRWMAKTQKFWDEPNEKKCTLFDEYIKANENAQWIFCTKRSTFSNKRQSSNHCNPSHKMTIPNLTQSKTTFKSLVCTLPDWLESYNTIYYFVFVQLTNSFSLSPLFEFRICL